MKKRILVLHAQVPFMTGGAEHQVRSLTENLIRRGFEAGLVQIPFKWYPKESLFDSMFVWRMLDLTESNGQKIDMVIPTKFPTYGIAHENKLLWLIHQHRAAYDLYDNDSHFGFGTIEDGELMRKTVIQFDNVTISESKKVFSESHTVSSRLLKYNNIPSEPLYHPPAFVGKYHCESYGNYIFSAGRLDPLKRIDLLLKALKHCDSNVKVKISGSGPEAESLKKLAEKLNISDRVDFLGFVSDKELIELYANARAIYFAPVDEDYGYITLEAFLSKKPIITCIDSGGVLEFANARNAFICDINPESVGAAINKVYSSIALVKEMGFIGETNVKNITWDSAIDKIVEYL